VGDADAKRTTAMLRYLPHQNDCRKVGACLDDVNAEYLAVSHNQHPRLMTPAQTTQCMDALKRGMTLRRVFGGRTRSGTDVTIVSPSKFRQHCIAYPAWGAEAMELAEKNRKAADRLKGIYNSRANETHCRKGHAYSIHGAFRPYRGRNAGQRTVDCIATASSA
jgi:hypothetical protein